MKDYSNKFTNEERTRVDEIWGDFAEKGEAGRCINYQDIEYVREIYGKRFYPKGKDFLDVIHEEIGGTFRSLLVLGCGNGGFERDVLRRGYASMATGIDISSRALKHAQKLAEAEGHKTIRYIEADLNNPPDDLGTYQVIMTPASLHHFEELDHLFEWLSKTLDPDGILAMGEYVGPNRFQWTPKQIDLASEVLELIPEHFRRFSDPPHDLKTQPWAPSEEEIRAHDPTEAVCSAEILPMLEKHFDIVQRFDLGGGLLFPLLQGIAHHFRPENPDSLALLKFLLFLDDLMLREGILPTHLCDLIARPRKR